MSSVESNLSISQYLRINPFGSRSHKDYLVQTETMLSLLAQKNDDDSMKRLSMLLCSKRCPTWRPLHQNQRSFGIIGCFETTHV